ncbi:NAD dependent epimerase/dehydratase family protein [Nitzschia inconspicua]|uniref:NAD dependent epimerase/dehydratase family protein n=1 Tax=Nitzschia inconspicua TaxID=303405 RepID=A0A9K3PZD7_9STRA|nr:NAD dependent epimerase/dehydratase family protein [Nitzschia inconspicua]
MYAVSVLLVLIALQATDRASAFAPSRWRASRVSSTSLKAAALIVQNKGGGHGEIGFQLAKKLAIHDKIDSITILQDDACNEAKEPFSLYGTDLPSSVTVVKAPLGDESVDASTIQSWLNGAKFEYIFDNNSKGPTGSGKAICDCAKSWDCNLYVYVSSAGMYKPDDSTTFPMDEATTPIKESAGQAQQDAYAVELGLPLVSFRPQYIYGPNSNKYDYIDWYFDRLVRQQPLPIPSPGTQKVSLTNSQDVASLLMTPLDNEAAAVQQRYFNCGTDQLYTYDEVAYMCAEVAGIDTIKIEHYDGEALGKAKFPFRMTDFYVAPDKAKEKLGYSGAQCDLKEDLKWYYEGYVSRGGLTREVDFSKDQEILGGVSA